jgi:hypothetical protein
MTQSVPRVARVFAEPMGVGLIGYADRNRSVAADVRDGAGAARALCDRRVWTLRGANADLAHMPM